MFYRDWKIIFEKIVEDFNFLIENDIQSTKILDQFLQNKKKLSFKKLKELIQNKEVIVFGAGPSLESSILINKNKFIGKIKIVADGATSALLKNNILPDLIVTDLDGKVSDQIKANLKGSIAIIHAHGDNIDNIKKYFLEFKGEIIGTTQIDSRPYKNVHNFGGFTDGDRAIFLAEYFHAKKIYLIGFDFNGEIGKYSFSENKDINLKLKKLKWCKYLIELLKKNKKNIYYL
jgi:2-amino-4-hydroxy-6-hydroxymethyldihydropteridine diphosphokinase